MSAVERLSASWRVRYGRFDCTCNLVLSLLPMVRSLGMRLEYMYFIDRFCHCTQGLHKFLMTCIDNSLVPRPPPSFLSLAVRKSGRGPGTFPHVDHGSHFPYILYGEREGAVWEAICLLSRSTSERRGISKVTNPSSRAYHTKKIRRFNLLCALLFCINDDYTIPLHMLVTDVIEGQGGHINKDSKSIGSLLISRYTFSLHLK